MTSHSSDRGQESCLQRECLTKKFSFGVSLEIPVEDYSRLLDEFNAYIFDAYFSLPLGAVHHSRARVRNEFARPGAESRLLGILDLLRQRGIRLEVALNTDGLGEEDFQKGLAFVADRFEPDSVVTLGRFGEAARRAFPGATLVYSYNNGVRTSRDIDAVPDVFDEIVLGNACIRNLGLFAHARERGLQTKLLLNNGCSFNCAWCRSSDRCRPTFERNLVTRSAEDLYALQSLFPWELHEQLFVSGLIDRLKISSRPSTYTYLRDCIGSYIRGGERELVARDRNNYRLWARLFHFGPYFWSFEYDRIIERKREIWRDLAPA